MSMSIPTISADAAARLRRTPADELPEYLTRSELAAYTGIAVQTLARWAAEGTGPKITRLGRHVRYRRAHVIAYLDAGSL